MGPDFLVLNIDYQNEFNGPIGYDECGDSHNAQCFWPTPGEFGLHGVGDTPSRLSDSGSSGCVRHSNEAITSIYNLLKNETGEIRYYINND
jgi:lipoprotein-anchoring transpeptidase ErfK/SrfK